MQRGWVCFALTAGFPCARRWSGLLSQSQFFWSPEAEGTFLSTDIRQLALFQPFQKTGIAPIPRIGYDHVEGLCWLLRVSVRKSRSRQLCRKPLRHLLIHKL